jgi:hypothetical protein
MIGIAKMQLLLLEIWSYQRIADIGKFHETAIELRVFLVQEAAIVPLGGIVRNVIGFGKEEGRPHNKDDASNQGQTWNSLAEEAFLKYGCSKCTSSPPSTLITVIFAPKKRISKMMEKRGLVKTKVMASAT